MINLLPLTKLISAVAILYAFSISAILLFFYDANIGSADGIYAAFKGATLLNMTLLGVVSFGWRWLWRALPFLNKFLFPDLNGEWDMTIHWQWNDNKGVAKATAYIKQDLLKISMEVTSGDSDSITLMAKPKRDPESGRAILYYVYRSTPKLKNGTRSLPYDGTAILKIDHNSFDILAGNYYTDRLTVGHYQLKRKDK